MQNYLETLNALIKDKIVNVEDYYVITLQGGVKLQGHMKSDIIKSFKRKELDELEFITEDHGYISIEFRYNSTIVEITLT